MNKFLWGSATASYQCEGAWQEDNKIESMWDHYLHEKNLENAVQKNILQRGLCRLPCSGKCSCDFVWLDLCDGWQGDARRMFFN